MNQSWTMAKYKQITSSTSFKRLTNSYAPPLYDKANLQHAQILPGGEEGQQGSGGGGEVGDRPP